MNRASWRAAVVAGALGVTLATPGSAQQAKRDSACHLPQPAHDSVHVVVTAIASVDPAGSVNLSPEFLQFVVEAVRTHYRPPEKLELPALALSMPVPPTEWLDATPRAAHWPTPVTRALFVDAAFTLNAHGAPRDIRVGRASASPALEASVASAIAAIVPDDYGLIPPRADGARIRFRLSSAPYDFKTEQPFFATWLPVYQLQKPAAARPDFPMPTYPPAARANGVEDSVTVQFVIDADGHTVPGTIDVLGGEHQEFIDSVVAAVLHGGYFAAVADGCAVPAAVRQFFSFHVGRR